MHTAEQWDLMTRASVIGLTDEQRAEVVRRLLVSDARGAPSSIWHEAAAVCGKPCHCAKCRPDIRRFA